MLEKKAKGLITILVGALFIYLLLFLGAKLFLLKFDCSLYVTLFPLQAYFFLLRQHVIHDLHVTFTFSVTFFYL